MHPRVKSKYFSNLLVLRIGVHGDKEAFEFLPEKKVKAEIQELEEIYPQAYVLRVFNLAKADIVYDKIAKIDRLFSE